jgi:hypothetical protein
MAYWRESLYTLDSFLGLGPWVRLAAPRARRKQCTAPLYLGVRRR